MRKVYCLALVEFAILVAGIGMDRLFPAMSAYGWFAIALLALAAIPVMYWPEIRGWWVRQRSPAVNNSSQIEETCPNWTMPELIQYIYSEGDDLAQRIGEIEDKARLGQLACWGRQYSVAGPGRNPNPLRDIPREHWDHYELDMLRCVSTETDERASLCGTKPRAANFREHDHNDAFQDLRVNRAQARSLWPSSEGEESRGNAILAWIKKHKELVAIGVGVAGIVVTIAM